MFTIIGADGNKYGPVPVDQIRRWIAEGRATLATQAQRVGEESWKTLGDFSEFAPQQPPPAMIPPASVSRAPFDTTAPFPAATETNTPFVAPTPVAEEKPLAARSVRLVAALIDGFLSMLFMLPGLVMIAVEAFQKGTSLEDIEHLNLSSYGAGFTVLTISIFILAVIQMWLLTATGQTVGKKLMGIRVVRLGDESNPGFVRVVLLRTFVPGLIGSLPFGIGILFTLVDICFIFRSDRRCLHDLIADTKVVEK